MCNKCKAPTFLSRTSNPFQNKVNFSLNMIILKDEYNKHFGLRGRRNSSILFVIQEHLIFLYISVNPFIFS